MHDQRQAILPVFVPWSVLCLIKVTVFSVLFLFCKICFGKVRTLMIAFHCAGMSFSMHNQKQASLPVFMPRFDVRFVLDQADCFFFPVMRIFLSCKFCFEKSVCCGCVLYTRRPTLHWSQHGQRAARSLATCSRRALAHQTMTLALTPAGPCLSPWHPSQHALHALLPTHTLPS